MKNRQLWLTLLLLLAILIISIGNYQRWWDLHVKAGPISSTHWLGIIGAGYIAIMTPAYAYMKRNTRWLKNLLTLHVFGNLLAFLLVSIHFTQQISRPAEYAAVHSTGLTLYWVVAIMVATGLVRRFGLIPNLASSWRFIHVSLSLSIYIILLVHILQFFDIL